MKEVRITLTFREDENGQVMSTHDFASLEDAQIAESMKLGGIQQIAFALLTEAARRETFVSAMVKMSAPGDYLEEWLSADEEGRKKIEETLGHAVRAVMSNTLLKVVPGAAKEVLEMVASSRKVNPETPSTE